MDVNLAVMTIGATTGVTYGTERMCRSKGGVGGRIITTASGAGLIVSSGHGNRDNSLSTDLKFQKVDFGDIDQAGYSMSKHGNVVLTRMYPHFKPAPADDGVKAYALCPWFIPTRLVTDEYKGLNSEEAKLKVAQEIHRESRGLTRMLVVEEVGEALMHSLRRDADGAAYMVFPDMPLFEVPDPAYPLILCLFAVGKVASALGKGSLNAKEVVLVLLFLFYVGFYLLHFILMTVLSIIF